MLFIRSRVYATDSLPQRASALTRSAQELMTEEDTAGLTLGVVLTTGGPLGTGAIREKASLSVDRIGLDR